MADFYMKRGDQQFGPYKASRLKQHADDGRVLPSDLIRQGEEGKWYPASSVKGLFSKEPVKRSADAQDPTSELDPEAEDEAMALPMQSTDVSVAAPSAATARDTSPRSTPTEAPQPADTNPNLRACPDCEKMVSKRAAACPSCGAPLEPPQPSEPSVHEQVLPQVLAEPVDEETVNLNRDEHDSAQQEEMVYFSENCKGAGQVQVTSSRVILPTQVYPLSNIASVRWGNDNRRRLLPLFMTIVGFSALAGCLVGWIIVGYEISRSRQYINSNFHQMEQNLQEDIQIGRFSRTPHIKKQYGETLRDRERKLAEDLAGNRNEFLLVSLFLFLIAGGAYWVGLSGYKSLQKAKAFFYLFVGTAGGETPQLGGTNRRFFERLVASINKAIVDRGGH